MDAASYLEQRFLGRLDDAAVELRGRLPTLKTHVYAASIGGLTPFCGRSAFLECLIPGASEDASDNVGLEIGLRHIHSSPDRHRRRVDRRRRGGPAALA